MHQKDAKWCNCEHFDASNFICNTFVPSKARYTTAANEAALTIGDLEIF